MTNAQIKSAVAGFLARPSSKFAITDPVTIDLLQISVNLAQQLAQRLTDFYYARISGYMSITPGTPRDITDGTVYDMAAAAITMKKFLRFWSNEDKTNEIPFLIASDRFRDTALPSTYIYQNGEKLIYVTGDTSATTIYFDGIKQLPELSGNNDSNFLTTYCADWLILQAAMELQNFIREDERIAVSAGLLRFKWDSIVSWNEGFESNVDVSLD